jgi:pimeloyl-ACP methyl ester carboxylesterase
LIFLEESTLTVPDGRRIEVVEAGERGAPVLLFQHGVPGVAECFSPWVDAAVTAGWRWVSFTRPGNGCSDRRRGRSVADNCTDVVAVLDALGAREFVTVGCSGGGPHALACAALLSDRCRGAITLAGLGPVHEMRRAGLDPSAGMGAINVGQFAAARAGEDRMREVLAPFLAGTPRLDWAAVSGILAGLMADSADRDVLTGEFADDIAAGYRLSTLLSADGWVDDFLAVDGPWGFSLDAIRVPVGIWHGADDRTVPPAHSRFVFDRLADPRWHILGNEGHLSLILHRFDDVLAEARSFLWWWQGSENVD